MAGKIGILVIHGIGSQQSGYSGAMVKEVSDRLDAHATSVIWQEVLWADVLASRARDLWQWMNDAKEPNGSSIDLDWPKIRKFLIHNMGDALAYTRDADPASAYAQIHDVVDRQLRALKTSLGDPAAPIVVMGHSLGAHIISNYIWDRQHGIDSLEPIPTLAAMITFGCNIPLFGLPFDVARPIDLPGTAITKAKWKTASHWLNYLDEDDVLGWPLKPLYQKKLSKLTARQKRTVSKIEDYEINAGGLLTNWNPAAHNQYWTDDDFTRSAAAYLRRLCQLL
jgi:hypothetical protein